MGSAIIRRLMLGIRTGDLGGLSTPASHSPYGPRVMRADDGVVPSPRDTVMILRAPTTLSLDTGALLIADYRGGQAWQATGFPPLLHTSVMARSSRRSMRKMFSQNKTPRTGAHSANS